MLREKQQQFNVNIKTRLYLMGSLIVVLLFLSIYVFLKAWNAHTVKQLFYTETSFLDYKVCLKANEYFSEKCLDKDHQYIANLIDNIEAEFKYNLNASDLFAYNYKYYVTAKIIASEKSDPNKILYSKEDTIFEEKTFSDSSANSFIITENISIDYTKYNDLMMAFRKDYTLTLDSKLIVTMHIELNGKYDGIAEEIDEARNISITIPLSEQTLNINMDYNDINESNLIESIASFNFINILLYILSFILMLSSLFLIYIFLNVLKKIAQPKESIDKNLKKILREYDQLIVETDKMPDLSENIVVDVSSFTELLDVRDVIHKPIIYYKAHDHALFVITNNNESYRYILKKERVYQDEKDARS